MRSSRLMTAQAGSSSGSRFRPRPDGRPVIGRSQALPAAGTQRDTLLRRTLVLASLGAFLSVLELTVVNVSLNTLERELHGSIASVQWIVTAYLLALAAV